MKIQSRHLTIFFLLVTFIVLTGCIQPGMQSDTNQAENQTAAAIGIAVNSSSVTPYLTEPWVITDVNFNATTSIAGGGHDEITLHTPDVVIDTPSRVLHVYVNMANRSVVYVWNSPKRVPYP
jgi:hypothetical protein